MVRKHGHIWNVCMHMNCNGCFLRQDIRHQRLYRQRRRADTLRLKQTLSSLQEKSSAHSQQVDYYSQYITSCLDSLTAR